ncbi:hypothetical protein PIB30_034286 [Stylosanthes scabra]|uniref:Replication factor A C-terminal domain-containing protein n=1 Tax=Stylosanthes scabra TaxID=79078 RepID=A0ABU6ZAH2_9FABA|nr:hypothetical protein [Stylosanthes scabra]
MEDDFLNIIPYKAISEIKDLIEKTIRVTIRTVNDFTSVKFWWYKGCNNCPNAVKQDEDTYKCPNCQWKVDTFTPKYALNLKVADENSYASFGMYETIGSDYLNISASDLRTKHIMRVIESSGDTTDGESTVQIPPDILIKDSDTALDELIDFVYPDMLINLKAENYFKDRAIFPPTLECVADVNNRMIARTTTTQVNSKGGRPCDVVAEYRSDKWVMQ